MTCHLGSEVDRRLTHPTLPGPALGVRREAVLPGAPSFCVTALGTDGLQGPRPFLLSLSPPHGSAVGRVPSRLVCDTLLSVVLASSP